jgi:hypothetical protein
LAEHGFFAKELNVGWAEWTAAGHPTETGRAAEGELRPATQAASGA